jgi:hypothetical protein
LKLIAQKIKYPEQVSCEPHPARDHAWPFRHMVSDRRQWFVNGRQYPAIGMNFHILTMCSWPLATIAFRKFNMMYVPTAHIDL